MKKDRTMDRRSFLQTSAMAVAGTAWLGGRDVASALAPLPVTDAGAATLPALTYAYDALVPYIDARTMEIHHTRHHAAYIANLLKALEPHADLQRKSLETLLADLDALPSDIRTAVRNNGGGHYNHSLFWTVLSPEGGGVPDVELARAIARQFGSFDSFKLLFNQAAATQFGSGWAWLITDEAGRLSVVGTPNQDNPLMAGVVETTGTPLLGLDVWEHAYYLHYQNRRADYIQAWWNVVNWAEVSRRFLLATA